MRYLHATLCLAPVLTIGVGHLSSFVPSTYPPTQVASSARLGLLHWAANRATSDSSPGRAASSRICPVSPGPLTSTHLGLTLR